MSAQPKPNEPSMEEILASIRRIIADDEKPAAPPEPEPEPVALAPEPEPEPVVEEPVEDDVLDLGAEASRVEEPAPEPAPPAAEHHDDIAFAEPQLAEPSAREPEPPSFEPPPQPAAFVPPPFEPAPSQPSLDMAALISEQTGAAVNNAFSALAHTVLNNNARTLEDLVKDMLKPMLKSWLDDNLPTMVERLVRAEIERVARGGRH